MNRGAWPATVHWVAEELDTTERLNKMITEQFCDWIKKHAAGNSLVIQWLGHCVFTVFSEPKALVRSLVRELRPHRLWGGCANQPNIIII